jgi:hypothetical protein
MRVFEDRESNLDGEIMLSWNEIKVIDFFSTKMKGDIHFEIT